MDLSPFARMGALWIFIAACCGFALWAPSALWNQATAAPPAHFGEDAQNWWDDAWPTLLQDEPAWMMAERGAELVALEGGFQKERGFVLLERALELARGDAHALLRVSAACNHAELREWCSDHGVFDQLIEAEPDNALSYLVALTQAGSDNAERTAADTPENRALLASAAQAPRFDTHRHQGFSDMLNAVDGVLYDIPLGDKPNLSDLERFQAAAQLVFARMSVRPSIAYARLMRFCERAVATQRSGAVEDCESIATRLQSESEGHMDRRVGFELERRILIASDPTNPDVKRLAHLSRAWGRTHGCRLESFMDTLQSPSTDAGLISEWALNLEEQGELKAAEWASEVQYSGSDSPTGAECDELLVLADEPDSDWADHRRNSRDWLVRQLDG